MVKSAIESSKYIQTMFDRLEACQRLWDQNLLVIEMKTMLVKRERLALERSSVMCVVLVSKR
jgi:hypothetical protein